MQTLMQRLFQDSTFYRSTGLSESVFDGPYRRDGSACPRTNAPRVATLPVKAPKESLFFNPEIENAIAGYLRVVNGKALVSVKEIEEASGRYLLVIEGVYRDGRKVDAIRLFNFKTKAHALECGQILPKVTAFHGFRITLTQTIRCRD